MISHWILFGRLFSINPIISEKREALKLGVDRVDTQVILVQKGGKPESTAKKTEETYAKKIEFSKKKNDTYIFLMLLLGWFQVTGIPLPSKIPRSVGPQPAPVAPGAQRRTGGRPGMWPSAPGRAGASPHCSHGAAADDVLGLGEGLKLLVGMRNGLIWGDVSGIFWGFFGDMVDEWCVVHGQSFDVGMVKKGVYRGCRKDRDYKDGDGHGETEKDSPKSWPILILKKHVHSSPSFIVSSSFVLPCHQKAPHPRPCLCCHPLSATSGAHRRRQPSYYRWPWDPWHISHPRPFQSSSRPDPLGVEARDGFGGLGIRTSWEQKCYTLKAQIKP